MNRVLILTASFGEGHNTASRNIRDAILSENPNMDVRICDLYAETNPRLNRAMTAGYRIAINRATKIWHMIFKFFDQPGAIERTLPLVAKMRDAFGKLLEDFRPDVVVSTYPIYGFIKDELAKKGKPLKMPFVVVVTDSTEINSAWFRRPADAFLVPDEGTKARLVRGGIKGEVIHSLGFPVTLRFEKIVPITANEKPPYRVLVMPAIRRSVSLRILRTVLARKDTTVTLVTGRHKGLEDALRNSAYGKDPRCKIIGWTDQMPELLASHHLFIGKAGGAIVQEAIAAQCPILVSHVVPGQEEGNIILIMHNGIGALANTPELLSQGLEAAFCNDGTKWKQWKENMAACSCCEASRKIARFILAMPPK